jgi:hypothetical protein
MLELTETVIRHDWEQVDDGPDGDGTRLFLSASLGRRNRVTVSGAVERPGVFPHRLLIEDWELTGPPELCGPWRERARFALDQLRLRVAGASHAMPHPNGRWDLEVRHRLRTSGAEEAASGLAPGWTFTPRQLFVDVSTAGAGRVCLFGDGPVEIDSARYEFAVGTCGTVAFEQMDPDAEVPDWAREPVQEVALDAFALREAADRHLRHGITTGQG